MELRHLRYFLSVAEDLNKDSVSPVLQRFLEIIQEVPALV